MTTALTQIRTFSPFVGLRYGGGGNTPVVEEPDFMRGSLKVFPYLLGEVRMVPHLAGDIAVQATLDGRIDVNP